MVNSSQPEKFTDFKLKASYWYVTHKFQLRRVLVIFLILLNVGFYGYSLYKASVMLFVEQPGYLALFRNFDQDLIDYQFFRQKNQPQPLAIGSFVALPGPAENFDLVVLVNNPNANWTVRQATAQLLSGGEIVAERNIFIYPGEEKYVVFFNQAQASPTASQIRLVDVHWQRQPNFSEFGPPRLNFSTSNVDFQPVTRAGGRGELPISSLNFTIANNSAYSYWQVGVYMVLLTGSGIGGINYIALDQFKSGQIRPVAINWYGLLPPISSVKILPEVDIFNPTSYMPVE